MRFGNGTMKSNDIKVGLSNDMHIFVTYELIAITQYLSYKITEN